MYFNFLADEVDNLTYVTTIASIIAVVLAIGLLVLICLTNKKLSSKTLAYAGVSVALSFVLSLIKVSPVTYGGSITLASMLPIIIFCYFYGLFPSLIVGVVYGLLQFLSDPYVLTPFTFILDYLLAFLSVAIVPIIRKFSNKKYSLLLAILCTYVLRFLFHLVSGVIYFNMGAVWAELPTNTAFGYSFLYQVVYLVPDAIITTLVAFTLIKTNVLPKLEKLMLKTTENAN